MLGGYMGKMLFVNLTDGSITEEALTEDLAVQFIGGYGLGAKILYDRMKPGIDPLGPENILGFVTGPATGSSAFFGCRYMVVCKSPVTGGWNDANSGGYFGTELKKAGYDAVFFTGMSEKPVYLYINEGKAELKDADFLWGKDTKETCDALIEITGQPKLRVSAIGPAGEQLSLISAVINDGHRAAARGGPGAVMGSKKLKAIAVYGNAKVPVGNPEKLREINRRIADIMKGPLKDAVAGFSGEGTGGNTPGAALDGNSPVKNWEGIGLRDFGEEAADKIGSSELNKYKIKTYACAYCPLACGAEYEVTTGKWPIGKTERPEYETASAFGTLLLNSDSESILACNELCNRLGLDTISTGGTIGWAMECYEKGVLTREDLDGIDLSWGNSDAIVAITEKIGRVEGCGAILAKGSNGAAQAWGKGADFLQTICGMELPLHDPKYAPGFLRTYQHDPTPGRHVKGGLGHAHEVHDLENKYDYNDTGFLDMYDTVNFEVLSSAGFCLFMNFPCPEGIRNEYIEAVTGKKFGLQECYFAGKRILNLRQAFNLREGVLSPRDRVVPPRVLGTPPYSEGPLEGITVDHERLGRNFYVAVGWDVETGYPTLESLRSLGGLENVIRDLYGDDAV